MDKDDLLMGSIIGGLIICSPLIGIYYGTKWVIENTPKRRKKKKEILQEICQLEILLNFSYDPYFYKRKERNSEAYLNSLRNKIKSSYKAPDIIIAIEHPCYLVDNPESDVMLLLHKNYYNIPQNIYREKKVPFKSNIFPQEATAYFKSDFRKCFSEFPDDYDELETLSECGRYEDYYIIPIPGKFPYDEVLDGSDKVEMFIDDFKKKYKKSYIIE